jgi:hypothetical protein
MQTIFQGALQKLYRVSENRTQIVIEDYPSTLDRVRMVIGTNHLYVTESHIGYIKKDSDR